MNRRTPLLALLLLLTTGSLAQQVPLIGYNDAVKNATKRSQPWYPPLAKTAGIQGRVVVAGLVNEKGDVTATKVILGHPMLAEAATDALRRWKFKPFEINGNPASIGVEFEANFNGVTAVFGQRSN